MGFRRKFDQLYAKTPGGSLFLPVYGVDDTPADAEVVTWDGATGKARWSPPAAAGAPADAEYIVGAAHAGLLAERVVTDTTTVDFDTGTAAQLKAHAIGARVSGPTDLAYGSVSDGQFLRRSGSNIIGFDGTSGGSGTFQYFDPDKPESSPSSSDDEFNGTTLSGNWTQVQWGTNMSYDQDTTAPGGLWIRSDNGGTPTNLLRAIVKSLAAGDFTIQTQIVTSGRDANFHNIGLVLADGTTPGAGNQCVIALVNESSQWRSYAQQATNWDWTSATTKAGPWIWYEQGAVIRCRLSGSNFTAGWSRDGRVWRRSTNFTLTWTPTQMGLFLQNQTASDEFEAQFKHFRYAASATKLFGGLRTVAGG